MGESTVGVIAVSVLTSDAMNLGKIIITVNH